jgi:hypothetical protein
MGFFNDDNLNVVWGQRGTGWNILAKRSEPMKHQPCKGWTNKMTPISYNPTPMGFFNDDNLNVVWGQPGTGWNILAKRSEPMKHQPCKGWNIPEKQELQIEYTSDNPSVTNENQTGILYHTLSENRPAS